MDVAYQLRPFLTLGLRGGREPRLYRRLFGRRSVVGRAPAITLGVRQRWPSGKVDPRDGISLSGTHQGIPWRSWTGRDPVEGCLAQFTSPIFCSYLSFHITLLPLIREELNAVHETLLIGAAFGHDGRATVLLGRGGSGKTRTMLRAVERGAVPIADEYFSVSAHGNAYPLLDVVGLRENVRRQAPNLYRALPRRLKLALTALRATGLIMYPPLLLHATWGDVGLTLSTDRDWKVGSVWWLDPNAGGGRGERLPPAEMAQRAVAHLAGHDRWYRPPGAPISLAGGAPVRELLTRAFSAAECYVGPAEVVPIDSERNLSLSVG